MKSSEMELWRIKYWLLNALNDSTETPDKLLQSIFLKWFLLNWIFNKKSTEDKWVRGYKNNVKSEFIILKKERKVY